MELESIRLSEIKLKKLNIYFHSCMKSRSKMMMMIVVVVGLKYKKGLSGVISRRQKRKA
jgi:hypothetical protein